MGRIAAPTEPALKHLEIDFLGRCNRFVRRNGIVSAVVQQQTDLLAAVDFGVRSMPCARIFARCLGFRTGCGQKVVAVYPD